MTLPAWHAHVDVWLILGSVVAAYLIAVPAARARDRAGHAARATRRLFLAGWRCCGVASDWPIHDLAERTSTSAHMVQHMLYTLVAAPLLVAGIPAWMWRSRPAAAAARAWRGGS